jgi:nicotinamidase-related amidase
MLKAKRTAVVLIDVQEKLLAAMPKGDQVAATIAKLLAGAKELDVPVLWCEQAPDKLGPTVETLHPFLEGLKPVEKTHFSCFGEKKFRKRLDDVMPKQVLLAGVETHVCVYQTAAELLEADHEVQVVADCVTSRTEQNHELGLTRMAQLGATHTSVEMCLFELQRKASGDTFRAIHKIIK